MNIGVVGAGTWGLALADIFSEDHNITVYSSSKADVLSETRIHPQLKKPLSDSIIFTSDLQIATKNKDCVIVAVPSFCFKDTIKRVECDVVISATKGLIDGQTPSEIGHTLVLSGPTHAEEAILRQPTKAMLGYHDYNLATKLADELSTDTFELIPTTETKSLELCATIKNTIAILTGITDGLGYGDNTKAVIITEGYNAMCDLCKSDIASTIGGLGDLIVTCTSLNSRNYRYGQLIGKGVPSDKAQAQIGMVVEGINSYKELINYKSLFILKMLDDIIRSNNPRQVFNDYWKLM